MFETPEYHKAPQLEQVPDLTNEAVLQIETVEAFDAVGLRLNPELRAMLLEGAEHRFNPDTKAGNRRGSGYMQASRFMADVLREPCEQRARKLFDEKAYTELKQLSLANDETFRALPTEDRRTLIHAWKTQGEAARQLDTIRDQGELLKEKRGATLPRGGWTEHDERELARVLAEHELAERAYDQAQYATEGLYDQLFPNGLPEAYKRPKVDPSRVDAALSSLTSEGDVLMGRMMRDALIPHRGGRALPSAAEKSRTGTCTSAELYFLEVFDAGHGYHAPTILHDENDEPLMILKRSGEQSAMTLREVVVDGVRLPPGSLVALTSHRSWSSIHRTTDIKGVEFLRLTTLAVSPAERARTFGMAMSFQRENMFFEPDTRTIEDFCAYAERFAPVTELHRVPTDVSI